MMICSGPEPGGLNFVDFRGLDFVDFLFHLSVVPGPVFPFGLLSIFGFLGGPYRTAKEIAWLFYT